MEKKANQERVFTAQEALKRDKSKTHVLPMSEMGLIQMTRKRTREPLTRILCEPCFYCEGEGYIVSRQSVCYNVYREILRNSRDVLGQRVAIRRTLKWLNSCIVRKTTLSPTSNDPWENRSSSTRAAVPHGAIRHIRDPGELTTGSPSGCIPLRRVHNC